MADKCGFGCKFKKSMSGISLGFKQQMHERKEKQAKTYGFSSFGEWEKAAKKAKERGYSKAGKKRLREIEKRASGQNIAGGSSNIKKGLDLLDEFMGSKPAPKRRKAPAKRKTAQKYVVVGGKAYQKAAPKRRRSSPKRRATPRTREDEFFTF